MNKTIVIIGAGNMGQAISQGVLDKKVVTQGQLILTNSKTKNNKESVRRAEVIILAVKPQIAASVLEEIKDAVKDQLVISIMAGITIDTIQQALGEKIAVVRVMPNLAAKIGQSMSVWVKNKEVTDAHESVAIAILETIGIQLELREEKQINMATAISGSGPAYFFYVTELIEEGAVELGFSQGEAKILAKQTLLGSAGLLKTSTYSAEELRHAITSKGGTTEAALETFRKAKLQGTIVKGILAAFQRARQLGGEKK